MSNNNKFGVIVMRAMPLHLGHQANIDAMINYHKGNCMLVLGGKGHEIDDRHIYTYEQRKNIVQSIYKDLSIEGIPDFDNDKERFAELDKITDKYTKGKDILYRGGSQEDTEYYTKAGREVKIWNRQDIDITVPISATQVRYRLKNGFDLDGYIDPRVQKLVKDIYSQNIRPHILIQTATILE